MINILWVLEFAISMYIALLVITLAESIMDALGIPKTHNDKENN